MEKLVLLLVLVVFFSGCSSQEVDSKKPEELCIAKCKASLSDGVDLGEGPCLSNQIAPDWVCDVAHKPRMAEDNLLKNRCEAFANGSAHHFVELDPECDVIQVY